MGRRVKRQCQVVEKLTHAPDGRIITCSIATNNSRQLNMFQPGTCYARPIYPQINTCHFYKVHFEVLYKGIHARKHARSPVSRGGRPHWMECSTHAAPAHEAFVLPMEKKGKDGSSKILANAASLFSFFSLSLWRSSCCCVQRFLDDEDRCSGPT